MSRRSQAEQLRRSTSQLNAAVMDMNNNLRGQNRLLDPRLSTDVILDDTLAPLPRGRASEYLGQVSADKANKLTSIALRYPRAAKLYSRGLVPLDQILDETYTNTLEQSLKIKEERTGMIKRGPTRQTIRRDEYVRTVPRPGGVYKYRRPHFTTSPYFNAAASAR